MAGPEIGAPGPGQTLVFGAIVAVAHPETDNRLEATVLRAFGGADGVFYQIEPHTRQNTEPIIVRDHEVALVKGTWWPSRNDLMAARQAAGLDVVPGEILPVEADQRDSALVDPAAASDPQAVTAGVTAAQREAALLVGLDNVPATVTIDEYGELSRVGDPIHGWLVVPTERLVAGMAESPDDLRAMLSAIPGVDLNGAEPKSTLAALAARHTPERLRVALTSEPVRHLRSLPQRSADAGL